MEYRVLVIEDEHRMRRVLQLLLEERGYHVRTAGDGGQGMAFWEQWAPHAVLTDIRLPKADGMKILGFKNEKCLRGDLFFRLNAFHIHVPPLRERIEDIRELAPYFLERFSMELEKPAITIEDEALGVMNRYHWPGNVRELRNVMERAVLSCKNRTIRADDLPHGLTMEEDTARTGQTNHSLDLEAQEKRLIEEAIEQTYGNQAHAARLLNITRNTLRYRMKKYGIIGPYSNSHFE